MIIPDAAQSSHIAVIGGTGSGKTYAAIGMVTDFLDAGKRVCIIDPTGVWWGLRSSADGTGPGFPVVIFGGEHADVPIAETSGGAVARLIASRNLPAILDLSEMLQDAQIKFVLDFAIAIYALNKMPIHLVIDEADEFAPQNPMAEAKRVLHHVQRIARRGRVKGFRLLLITQRPAVLHKNVLSQAKTLIVMGLTAPQDRAAVGAWIEGQADETKGREVLDSLPQLRTGEGWIWSPANDVLVRTQFPKNRTFDSSRTPEDGEAIEPPATLADVDVSAIRASIEPAAAEEDGHPARGGKRTRRGPVSTEPDAEAIQRARTDGWLCAHHALKDAREQLAWLEQKGLETIQAARTTIEAYLEITEAPPSLPEYAGPAPRETVAPGVDTFKSYHRPKHEYARNDEDHASRPLKTAPQRTEYSPEPRKHAQPKAAPHPRAARDSQVSGTQQRILNGLAWLEAAGISPASRIQVALAATYSASSSHFSNTVSALRTAGMLDYPRDGFVSLTDAGRAVATKPKERLTTADLHNALQRLLSGVQWRILKVAIDAFPADITRAELAKRSGHSAESSHFSNTVSSLRTAGFIDYPESGKVVALPVLFLRGKK